MSILGGAFNGMIKGAGCAYLLDSYSVIPLIGKKCPMSWKVYQSARAHIADLKWWEDKGWLKNIGIVCGRVSNNLTVIDLDGQAAVDLFKAYFGDLMAKTFVVRTGSGGMHIYLHTDTMPTNRKISLGNGHSGIEIRGEGQYVVAVPSIHPDTGKPYQIAVIRPALRIDGLWEVNKWLDTLETPKTREIRPIERRDKEPSIGGSKPVVFRDRLGKPVKNPRAYASASLQSEIDRVGSAAKGDQNNALYRAAQRMGQFVGMGLLTESEVISALDRATWRWVDSDQTTHEIHNTIHSGLGSKAAEDTR